MYRDLRALVENSGCLVFIRIGSVIRGKKSGGTVEPVRRDADPPRAEGVERLRAC